MITPDSISAKYYAEMFLSKGKTTLIDLEDVPQFLAKRWHALKSKNTYYAYAFDKEKGRCTPLHRELISIQPGEFIDHIHHDGLDNRKKNLRSCSMAQNNQNRRRTGKRSQYKGVLWSRKRQSYQVMIGYKSKAYWIGSFKNDEDAALAYDIAAQLFHGEFARLNFPHAS